MIRGLIIRCIQTEDIDLSRIEARELHIKIGSIEFGDFEFEQIKIPTRFLVAAVVHQTICSDLGGRQPLGNMDRDLFHPALFRCQPADMSDDNDSIPVDDDRLAPTILLNRGADLVDPWL